MVFIRQQFTHIHSDIVASPYYHALRSISFLFLIEIIVDRSWDFEFTSR